MIPGAFEPRRRASTAGAVRVLASPVTPVVSPVPGIDRERLEREREGGGAPRERTDTGHRGVFGRLFDVLVGRTR